MIPGLPPPPRGRKARTLKSSSAPVPDPGPAQREEPPPIDLQQFAILADLCPGERPRAELFGGQQREDARRRYSLDSLIRDGLVIRRFQRDGKGTQCLLRAAPAGAELVRRTLHFVVGLAGQVYQGDTMNR